MGTVDIGKVAIRNRGNWSSDLLYEPLDFVTYTDGCGYICLVSNSNISPDSDNTKWALSVRGFNPESTVIEYTDEDVYVTNMEWDATHVFPVMPSLELSLGNIPNDGLEHQMNIVFETPSDITNFVLTADDVIWNDKKDLPLLIAADSKYVINISSASMIAVFDKLSADIPQSTRTIDEIEIVNPISTLAVGDEYALQAVGISNYLQNSNTAPKYDISYYNPIKFSSSDKSVATIIMGTLIGVGEGTCTITATDIDGNASAQFSLTVVAAHTVPEVSLGETYVPNITDPSDSETTTNEIEDAFLYAAANGYKKISFPQGSYKMNMDYRPTEAITSMGVTYYKPLPIDIPSDMVIDFNGSTLQIERGDATTATWSYEDSGGTHTSNIGTLAFKMDGCVNTWLLNVDIYAENYREESKIHYESVKTLSIEGASRNIHFENCSFCWAPGFNISLSYKASHYASFKPNNYGNNVEEGGLDDYGEPISQNKAFRCTDDNYVSLNLQSGGWVLGNYQGYQLQYTRSRLYDVAFYGEEVNGVKPFLFIKRNCYFYQRYEFPTDVTPKYAKIVVFQDDEPTGSDPDYHAYAMLVDRYDPTDIYFKNCTFEENWSTGISPQGGVHVVVDNCKFINNGISDPSSHIDWEDGRQNSQGHIIKNCKFITNKYYGQVVNGYCRNIVVHNCEFINGSFRTGSESVMARTYNNKFKDTTITLSGKMEYLFSSNAYNEPYSLSENSNGNYVGMPIVFNNRLDSL